MNALLASLEQRPKTHSGAKALFNKEFILTGKLDSRFSIFYSLIMTKRFEADYDEFVFIDDENIESLYLQAKEFVNAITQIMGKR